MDSHLKKLLTDIALISYEQGYMDAVITVVNGKEASLKRGLDVILKSVEATVSFETENFDVPVRVN